MDILKIQNLSIKIVQGDKPVPFINKVSFSLKEGQMLALVGQSGSGKTLTALAIMGLLPAGFKAYGQVILGEKDLLQLNEEARRLSRGSEIAYTMQNAGALNPALKIRKQLIEKVTPLSLSAAANLLKNVGLDKKVLNMYPHQLSGGMRQRVLLAIALAAKPKVLIADEPTSGLDTDTANQILDLIDRLRKDKKISTILISHDLAMVGSRADYIAVMKEGCIVEQGPKKEVFEKPAHSYTKALLEASMSYSVNRQRSTVN